MSTSLAVQARDLAATTRAAIRAATTDRHDALYGLAVSVRALRSVTLPGVLVHITGGIDVDELLPGHPLDVWRSWSPRAFQIVSRLRVLAADAVVWADAPVGPEVSHGGFPVDRVLRFTAFGDDLPRPEDEGHGLTPDMQYMNEAVRGDKGFVVQLAATFLVGLSGDEGWGDDVARQVSLLDQALFAVTVAGLDTEPTADPHG